MHNDLLDLSVLVRVVLLAGLRVPLTRANFELLLFAVDAMGRCKDDLGVDQGAAALVDVQDLAAAFDWFLSQDGGHPRELAILSFIGVTRDPEADAIWVTITAALVGFHWLWGGVTVHIGGLATHLDILAHSFLEPDINDTNAISDDGIIGGTLVVGHAHTVILIICASVATITTVVDIWKAGSGGGCFRRRFRAASEDIVYKAVQITLRRGEGNEVREARKEEELPHSKGAI